MDDVERELGRFRGKLVDLSLRNRLLNFKSTKRRTIQAADGSPEEIYQAIVLHEKAFWLQPIEYVGFRDGVKGRDLSNHTEDDSPGNDGLPEASAGPFHLKTVYEKNELARRLSYSAREAYSVMEEQGYTVLHLALCFLKWSESPASDLTCLAPLLLIPVRLERLSGERYKGNWTKEEVQVNEALYEKLKDIGIGPLPTFDKPDQLNHVKQYFRSWAKIAAQNAGWGVDEAIYLDFFNFTKIVMWKDLDLKRWPKESSPLNHTVLLKLFGLRRKDDTAEWLSEEEADKRCNFRNAYYVMDADPSQIAAVENIKNGHDLVLEGPPGTGKSQTIVNLVAESLATGKKVLFVSEKMAALEVVKKRLDNVGLGEFCAELHSRKANKKDFISALSEVLDGVAPTQPNLDTKIEELENLKKRLNDYAAALKEPFEPVGKSPYELLCMKEKLQRLFEQVGKPIPAVNFDGSRNCKPEIWQAAVSALTEMKDLLRSLGSIKVSPWNGCSPVDNTRETRQQIERLIAKSRSTGESLRECLEFWKQMGINTPDTWQGIPGIVENAALMRQSSELRPINRNALLKRELTSARQDAAGIIQTIGIFQGKALRLRNAFRPIAFDPQSNEIVARREMLLDNWFMLRHPIRHYRLKKEILGLYKTEAKKGLPDVCSDLEQLAAYLELQEQIEGQRQAGRSLFGNHWRGAKSNCEKLQSLWEWIELFHHKLRDGDFNDTAIESVCAPAASDTWRLKCDQLSDAWTSFSEQFQRLVRLLQPDWGAVQNRRMEDMTLPELMSQIESWERGLPRLFEWSIYLGIRQKCLGTIASPMVSLIETDEVGPDDLLPLFEGKSAEIIFDAACQGRSPLTDFLGVRHEATIEHFRRLDQELFNLNRARLVRKLYEMRPKIPHNQEKNSAEWKLKLQMNKKKGICPFASSLQKSVR